MKKQLGIALAAAAIATALPLASPAGAADATIEGESMAVTPSSAGSTYSDSTASGGSALRLRTNSTAAKNLSLPASANITVRAKGNQCLGAPSMTVAVDGSKVSTKSVSATAWTNFSMPITLAAGSHTVSVAFTNDFNTFFCDRSLLLDGVTVIAGSTPTTTPSQPGRMTETFTGTDGVIASADPPVTNSLLWEMTSGTLFRSNNTGWSGIPDDGYGTGKNGSAVFRMVSQKRDFGDVTMSLSLRVDRLVTTSITPAVGWDGVHIQLRYQSQYQLYYVTVDRRDGTMIIKKKCQGGPDPSNGGTYYSLTPETPGQYPINFGQWQHITVSVRDLPDGSVAITGNRDGYSIQAVDNGIGCAPLRGSAGVGIRGDNAELRLDDIVVGPAQ